MLASPVEFRYDDGSGSVVLIKTGGGNGSGTGVTGPDVGSPSSMHEKEDGPGVSTSSTTPNSRKIIIEEFMSDSSKAHPGGGSIMIVTPSHIKICINSGEYERKPDVRDTPDPDCPDPGWRSEIDQKEEKASIEPWEPAKPKPEPEPAPFRLADDVLVRMDSDDRFYLGTIVAVGAGRCLVRFDDQSNRWAAFSDITKLGGVKTDETEMKEEADADDDEEEAEEMDVEVEVKHTVPVSQRSKDLLCNVCGRNVPDVPVIQCESCDSRYHPLCEALPRDDEDLRLGAKSLCGRCYTVFNERTLAMPEEFAPLTCKTQLPYNLDGLRWDLQHRVNTHGHYCYCGADGDWVKEMIQCRRCRQWFHGRCIRSLQYPIFLGDTFYLFLCSICNHGHEFVRRLELSWANLAHLALYNLIMRNGPRFYDLRTAIAPYIEDNVRTLQLPDQLTSISTVGRIDHLQQALRNGGDRFINGKEINESTHIWTLQHHSPPPQEPYILPIPRDQTVTESLLQQKLTGTANTLRFLPRVYLDRNYVADAVTREKMIGINYASTPQSIEDPRSPKADPAPSATPATSINNVTINPQSPSTEETTVAKRRGRPPIVEPKAGTGCMMPVNKRKNRSRRTLPPSVSFARWFRKSEQPSTSALQEPYASSDDSSALTTSTLDYIIPPPKDFQGANNPFYNQLLPKASQGSQPASGRPRKARVVKRRLSVEDLLNLPRLKRRRIYRESSSSRASRVGATAVNSSADSLAVEPSELSWSNVQRHNIQHREGGVPRRSVARSCCSSSTSEQDARLTRSNTKLSPITDGLTKVSARLRESSSGRLRPRVVKDYSDTRRYKQRKISQPHNARGTDDGQLEGMWSKCTDMDDDNLSSCGAPSSVNSYDYASSIAQYSGSDVLSSRRSSCSVCSLMMQWVPYEPVSYVELPISMSLTRRGESNARSQRYVVMGRRTCPAGEKDLLLEAL